MTQKRAGFADVNGTRLSYEVIGAGPAVALLHGFALDGRMWDDQVEALARQGYRVVRYDARGFGRSAPPTAEPYAPADDLKALLTHLGIAYACIVGLSMGGRVAVEFAIAYPDATDALIAVDSGLSGCPNPPALRAFYGSVSSRAREEGLERAREAWLAGPLFGPARERPDVASRLTRIASDYSGWHWTHADPSRAPSPPAVQRLGEIQAPTLAVVGALDIPYFHTVADALFEGVPDACKAVVPGAGHLCNMEAPAAFNKLVLDFLSEIFP